MNNYFKFLAAGRIGPFSQHLWTTAWQSVDHTSACQLGLHACRAIDLPYWLHDELWRVELEGPVVLAHKVVGRRGRLIDQVAGWDTGMAARFGLGCIARTVVHAARSGDGALTSLSETLLAAADQPRTTLRPTDPVFDGVNSLVRERQEQLARRGETAAALACGYVADAIRATEGYPVAMLGHIATRAAGSAELARDERAWQADWLSQRLDL